jgi:folate-binding protein YgfZ
MRAYEGAGWGVLQLRGGDALDLVHRLSTNDLRSLKPGDDRWTVFTTHQGKAVDWSRVLVAEDGVWLTSSAPAALAAWIDKYTITEDVETADMTGQWHWVRFLDALPDTSLRMPGLPGHPGGGDAILRQAPDLVSPADYEAWRLVQGIPALPTEIADQGPLQARLLASIHWHKGCYIGQEVISRLYSYDKVARILMGVEGDVQPGDRLEVAGKTIGRVTSAAAGHALAYIERDFAKPGDATSNGRGVHIVERPFWQEVAPAHVGQ